MTAWPPVSVIMPVLNEERHLAFAVNGVLAQDYPGELELILAIGPSSDRTQQIADELAAADPRVRSVPNPTGRTPAALNAALAEAKHGIVVRVDGHGELAPGYIATAVRLLEETGAANVGGIMRAEGVTALRAGRGPRHDQQARRRQRPLPHRRRGRPVGHRLPRRLPPRGARRARRLRRALHPRAGLGAEPPHPRVRPADLVRPEPVGDLPAAPDLQGAGQAVQGVRPLAPRRDAHPRRHRQLPLPRPARSAAGRRRRHGRRPGRRSPAVRRSPRSAS